MPNKRKWKRKDFVLDSEFTFGEILRNEAGEGYSVPVHMTIRTDVPVSRWGYAIYHELSGMQHKEKTHVAWLHDSGESLGFLDKFDISDKEIVAHGQLVSIEPGDRTDTIVKKMQAGIPMESSIFFAGQGLKAEEYGDDTKFEVNGKSYEGPAIVFREWPLRGVALCPYGADNNTSASLALAEESVEFTFANKEPLMADEKEGDQVAEIAKLKAELAAKEVTPPTGKDFLDAFGSEGGVWFAEGKTFDEAQALFTSNLKKKNADLEHKLASVHRGGEDEDAPGMQDGDAESKEKEFAASLNDKVQKTALKIGTRLSFFASGIKMPNAEPQDVRMHDVLKDMYMKIVKDREEVHRELKFASPTLIDIAIQNAADGAVGLIDETIQAHPELLVVPARTIKGILYKTLVRVTLPTVAFRHANEGTASTKGQYVNRTVETYIMSPCWDCDKAVADRDEDGPEAFIAKEAAGILEATMQHICEVFYYGRIDANVHASAGDAKGFNGLHSQLGFTTAANILVDGLGTTGTADCTSVFMIKGGPQGVQWVWGNNGELSVSPVREERILDAGGTNSYTAYFQELLAYPGLQVGNVNCVGRIGELNDHATDTTSRLTDQYLAKLFSLFPMNSKPDHIFMNRQSQRQLRDSRIYATGGTVVGPGAKVVPFSFDWEGIPIHVTDAILNTEVDDKIS